MQCTHRNQTEASAHDRQRAQAFAPLYGDDYESWTNSGFVTIIFMAWRSSQCKAAVLPKEPRVYTGEVEIVRWVKTASNFWDFACKKTWTIVRFCSELSVSDAEPKFKTSQCLRLKQCLWDKKRSVDGVPKHVWGSGISAQVTSPCRRDVICRTYALSQLLLG